MNELTAVLVHRGVMRLKEALRKGSGLMTARVWGGWRAGAVRKCGKSVIEVDVWERSVVFRLGFRTHAVAAD